MSIRPIDLQVMLPHVTDIGKVQATQNQQMVVQQQQFAEQMQRQVEARRGQVEGTKKTEMPRVHREKPDEGQQHSAGAHSDQQESSKRQDAEQQRHESHGVDFDPVRGHYIDIDS